MVVTVTPVGRTFSQKLEVKIMLNGSVHPDLSYVSRRLIFIAHGSVISDRSNGLYLMPVSFHPSPEHHILSPLPD